jgi:endonuclease/exonuclease/phosphatase family metal-dependent hydrolase
MLGTMSRITALVVPVFLSASAVFAQDLKLHVMSYNIKGLPGLLTSSEYKSERYGIIGRLLAERAVTGDAPDVVFLQEAFSEDTRALFKVSSYPHVAQGPEYKTWIGLDSGLYILSRHPIAAKATREFKSYPNCNRWDCFANKGVQFARVLIPGLPRPLDLFNTHLQAGREDPPARRRQVRILVEFFREHHQPGNPVIFGGDFNIRPLRNKDDYDEFIAGTGLASSGKYCLDRGCARSSDAGWQGIWENAVDHQFYSSGAEVRMTPVRVERTFRDPVGGFKLSDHFAHEARFELKLSTPRSGAAAAAN